MGFEPVTSGGLGRRSTWLSYIPKGVSPIAPQREPRYPERMSEDEREYMRLRDECDRVILQRETLRVAARLALHSLGDSCPDAAEALKTALRVTDPTVPQYKE